MGPPGLPKLLVPFLPGRKDTKSKACLGSCSLAETGHLGGQILARCGHAPPARPPTLGSGAQMTPCVVTASLTVRGLACHASCLVTLHLIPQ